MGALEREAVGQRRVDARALALQIRVERVHASPSSAGCRRKRAVVAAHQQLDALLGGR